MADLLAIVRATQASARALDAMSRHARAAADAAATQEHNHRLVAAGRVSIDVAAMGNRIASAKSSQARFNYSRAQSRYRRAQRVLATNPLPGDAS